MYWFHCSDQCKETGHQHCMVGVAQAKICPIARQRTLKCTQWRPTVTHNHWITVSHTHTHTHTIARWCRETALAGIKRFHGLNTDKQKALSSVRTHRQQPAHSLSHTHTHTHTHIHTNVTEDRDGQEARIARPKDECASWPHAERRIRPSMPAKTFWNAKKKTSDRLQPTNGFSSQLLEASFACNFFNSLSSLHT